MRASPEASSISRSSHDLIVLGGGPAGLAAALAAAASGARTCLVEREERLGGILKQCVHDGFGLLRFGEALAGPEYARRFAELVPGSGIELRLETFVRAARVGPGGEGYSLDCISREGGVFGLDAHALILATGCRERSDRQVLLHGDRPAGVFTAGLAQRLVNVEGLLPGRRAVILGSGDIGLIMASRLHLEGVEVEGVYEIKSEPSGLGRNLAQCLEDFGIPLHLSTTVTEVHGRRRVEAVTLASVDQRGNPIVGTERLVECDTLVLSVGLIPENEVALSLGLGLDSVTRGPRVDQNGATELPGLYACGNAVHVSDLVDYVSETGEAAGRAAAAFAAAKAEGQEAEGQEAEGQEAAGPQAEASQAEGRQATPGRAAPRRRLPLKAGAGFLYAVPQYIDASAWAEGGGKAAIFFRANATMRDGARVRLSATGGASGGSAGGLSGGRAGGELLLERRFPVLRPPEAERLELELDRIPEGASGLLLELERNGPARPERTAP